MKFWIALIAILALIVPQAFAGDDAVETSSIGDEVTTYEGAGDHDPKQRQAILAHLAHHHEVPDRQTLEDVTDQARAIVFDIARDDEASPFHRQRALRALTNWADDEVYDYLVELLGDDETEDGLRHHLLPVLADGFGQDALDDLTPYLLDDPNPQVRMSAAHAIADIDTAAAQKLLVEALETEDNSVVERRLEGLASGDR